MFSDKGYDAVSVWDISSAVGIKAPSLYNHFSGKQAIFDAIVESTAKQYDTDSDKINIHIRDGERDVSMFKECNEETLFEKVKQMFEYSLHNDNIKRFRKMMTIEQYRSKTLSELYTQRFVNKLVDYHADIFSGLIKFGVIRNENPCDLALMYVAPILTLIGICDREPDKESECLERLKSHVSLFYRTVQR